jgi:CRISPR-associated Csx2 family protein
VTTLVTFIGRTEANRAYRLARYRFEDGVDIKSKLFAAAAVRWLRGVQRAPQRLIVIGTPTSGWDVLNELIESLAPNHAHEALEWAVPVSDALERGPLDATVLRDFEERFSAVLGVQLNLRFTANDGDSVFETLNGLLAPAEQVVLDITHSYRSMPVHALVCLGALRWLKGIELIDILYGSLDERGSDGVSQARSLGTTARLAHATPTLAQLSLMDDVGAVAPYLAASLGQEAIKSGLEDAQRLESIMQFDSAQVKRGQMLGQLRQAQQRSSTGVSRAIVERLAGVLASLSLGSGSLGLRQRAERSLERGDFMRAIGLANEALTLKVIELHDLRRCARDELRAMRGPTREFYPLLNRMARERLRACAESEGAPRHGCLSSTLALKTVIDARNAVMHAGANFGEEAAPGELLSPAGLRRLIEWALRFYDFIQ